MAAKIGREPERFIIAGGDKGGVGKSVTALTLIDVLTTMKKNVVVIETDTSNPDVSRMYKDALPCYHADLATENGWMDIMDAVTKHSGCTFLMNTPAGTGRNLKKHLPTFSSFLAHHKSPLALEMWWTMNPQHDTVNLLNEAINHYGSYFAKFRVVCNTHFSNNEQDAFFLWTESPLRTKMMNQGHITLFLEGLSLRVVNKLFDPDKTIPFADAVDASLGESVGLTESERFKLSYWRERQFATFSKALMLETPTDITANAA